jgi:broad specificity phosphatase PhoE
MPVSIVYETHATTLDNENGIATGWNPGELSAQGLDNARELGERRRNDSIAVVFTSDLKRAIHTVEIAFVGSDTPRIQDARLRECHYGELDGAAVENVAARRLQSIDEPFPGGESYTQVVARTASFLEDLARDHDGERVLIIAHSANRWSLEVLLEGKALADVISAPFAWQPGWEYTLPSGWRR